MCMQILLQLLARPFYLFSMTMHIFMNPYYYRVANNTSGIHFAREGANKQVISSQADSLIKISRIWADFFPANTSNQPI